MMSVQVEVAVSGPRGQVLSGLVFLLAFVGLGAAGFLAAPRVGRPEDRSIDIHARQYSYSPEVIRVNRGDTVHLRFVAEEVVHGFYLEGHDLDVTIVPCREAVEVRHPSEPGRREMVDEVVFNAGHEGKFRYRCSNTCGFMHPFMCGEFIVGPNRLLPTSLGLAVGLLLGGFLSALLRRSGS